jgi:hypothetical protein
MPEVEKEIHFENLQFRNFSFLEKKKQECGAYYK